MLFLWVKEEKELQCFDMLNSYLLSLPHFSSSRLKCVPSCLQSSHTHTHNYIHIHTHTHRNYLLKSLKVLFPHLKEFVSKGGGE